MKKFYSLVLALLLVAGVAHAANINSAIEPNAGGPEIWLMSVYNNSGSTLDVGDVVVWDVDASTGDNDNWVNTTTTADTWLVAGVVYPADIVAGASGSIVIKGPVSVDVHAAAGSVDGAICTSAVAGSVGACLSTGVDNRLGIATSVASGGSISVFVGE